MKKLNLILLLVIFPIFLFSKNKLLILLNPFDCSVCKGELDNFLPLTNNSFYFILPENNHPSFKTYSEIKIVQKNSNNWMLNQLLFDALKSNPSSFFLLNENNVVIYQTPIYGVPNITKNFILQLVKPNFQESLSNRYNLPFDLSPRDFFFKKEKNIIYSINANGKLFGITKDSVVQFDFNLFDLLSDSLLNSIKATNEDSIFKSLNLDPEEIIKDNIGKRKDIINYSVSDNEISILLQINFLLAKVEKLDTIVNFKNKYYIIALNKKNYIPSRIINISPEYLSPYNINYFSGFELLENNLIVAVRPPKTEENDPIPFILMKFKIKNQIIALDSVRGIIKMPKVIHNYYSGEFSDIHRTENLLYFVTEPVLFNSNLGKTISLNFADSFSYLVNMNSPEFELNEFSNHYYCFDIRQVDKFAYQVIFKYNGIIYLADVFKNNPILIRQLFEDKSYVFIKFIGNDSIIRNIMYQREIESIKF
jgi:hypothetical protein